MSANVDLVRSIYADQERGDFSRIDWADPALELVWADGPEPGRWCWLSAASQAWRTYLSAWQNLRVHAEEYREIDGERVLVLAHNNRSGKTSGFDLTQIGRTAAVFRIRQGG